MTPCGRIAVTACALAFELGGPGTLAADKSVRSERVRTLETDPVVTIARTGSGSGSVSANAGSINCGATCSGAYTSGTALTLTANAVGGGLFTGWLGPCTGTGPCTFTVGGDTTVTATFAAAGVGSPKLDIDGSGGYDALSDGLLVMRYLLGLGDPALIAGTLGSGAMRTTTSSVASYLLDARPALDVDGDGTVDPQTDGVLILRYLLGVRDDALVADAVGGGIRQEASAIESYIDLKLIKIIVAGSAQPLAGGAISASSNAPGSNCNGATCIVEIGSSVQLMAAPNTGYRFGSWSGDCTGTTATVSLSALKVDKSCRANFIQRFTVSVVSAGSGTVSISLQGSGPCAGTMCTVDIGSQVTLSAIPNAGFHFAGWTGAGCTTSLNPFTFMPVADTTCTGHFDPN